MKRFPFFWALGLGGILGMLLLGSPVLAQRGGHSHGGGHYSGGNYGGGHYGGSWGGHYGLHYHPGHGIHYGYHSNHPGHNYGGYYYDSGSYYRPYSGYYYDSGYDYPGYYYEAGYNSGNYGNGSYAPANGAAQIQVKLPDGDGEVWFDGQKTRQTGTSRTFVTPALEPGKSFSYQVSAAWHHNGRLVTAERTVNVSAGNTSYVDFTQPAFPPK